MSAEARDLGGKTPSIALLEKRVRELQLLHEMGRRITSILDVGALLPEMVEQLRRVLGVEIVSIMLVDDESGSLRIEAASGLPAEVVASARVPLGEGISGQVAARGEPVLIRDMSKRSDFDRSSYHEQYTTESLICVPLKLHDRVLGVINVNNKLDGEALDDHDLALVTTFSSQAALALENSRLYGSLADEVRRVTAELQDSNEELRRLQDFNERILRNMSSGLVAIDLEGRVTKLNASGASLLGVPEDGVEAETVTTLFGEDAADAILSDQRDAARPEVLARSRHGREVLVGYSCSPLLDRQGRETGRVILFRDLTEVKKMEAELVRMDRMASLGVLGAGIAHEIRNPLSAIRFNLDFLRESGPDRQELSVILKNVERLDDLVKKLLRFARPQQPCFAPQQIGPRVDAVVSLVGKQALAAGVELAVDLRDDLPDVQIDGAQVEQVILNIVLNGIQSMPDGGTLTLSARAGGSRREGHAELIVTDEGIGLSAEKIERIFDPFYTTRKEGTGLGLAVAQRIVEDHDGYITVEPREDASGTTFIVGFPLAHGEDAGS